MIERDDRLLQDLGNSWDEWSRIDLDAAPREVVRAYVADLGNFVARERGDAALMVLKEPRICRILPLVLQALAADHRVAGINFRDIEGDALDYLADAGNPFFSTGFDPRGRMALDWGVSAPPETFIIGGDGTVLFRFAGPLVGSDYEQRFLPALAAATAGQ